MRRGSSGKSALAKWLLLGVAGIVMGTAAQASTPASAPAPAAPSMPQASSVPGWDGFVDQLRGLPDRILAKFPEERRQDPQIRAEVGRIALEALTSSALDMLGSDPEHPSFVPSIGQVLNVGQPNADTVYRSARIDPRGVYRLRGERGTLSLFNISQGPLSPADPGFDPSLRAARPRHEFNALHVDANGRFDVILSPERPQGHSGDWWKLEPTTHMLLLRMVSADWKAERDPTLSIERLDRPVTRSRPSAAQLEAQLRQLPRATNFIAMVLRDDVEKERRNGVINALREVDFSAVGGLNGQFYYQGAYQLADDEALLIETPLPKKCGYRSLILTNYLFETTDWVNNQSSLNQAQSAPDPDGVLRVVVSARDPGVANWLDTAGNPDGMIQGRWADCDSRPVPAVRKVALADLDKLLPKGVKRVSPTEREAIIRERRSYQQERPLW